MKKIVLLFLSLSVVACSTASPSASREASVVPAFGNGSSESGSNKGVVNYVWEEPMADVVDVPPGLDPDGVYYRPAHQEVVEVRQGHWQHYQ